MENGRKDIELRSEEVQEILTRPPHALVRWGITVFFVVLGFGTKAGLFPMHNWLPSAHPVAPAPASALLSGIITKAGVIGIIRILYFIAGPSVLRGTWVQTACLVLALGTVFMGSMLAYGERDFKKRLAYSSISQISYVLTALFLWLTSPTGSHLIARLELTTNEHPEQEMEMIDL